MFPSMLTSLNSGSSAHRKAPSTIQQLALIPLLAASVLAWVPARGDDTASIRLPRDVPPVIGFWFWHPAEFEPEGYKRFVDTIRRHSNYNVVTAMMMMPKKEVADADVHGQFKAGIAYARQQGLDVAMSLDVRQARAAFQKAYPDELQEMLRLREVELRDAGEATLTIRSDRPHDHYTTVTTHYVPLAGRLVRVYRYRRGPEGIEPGTLEEITGQCRIERADAGAVTVAIPCDQDTAGYTAGVLAAFTHFTPDVFAPHLLPFQRELIQRYADTEMAGACKDEWGFPPCYDGCPAKNDFWYSRAYAAAYAQASGGRDLVADCLLMHLGQPGREAERQAAINHYLKLSYQRNGEIENDFYRATKETFGPQAIVATHPTWFPYPGTREFKKNGLHWWIATRDLAQTDEVTPFCVRTSLAKKWNSALWYNMYYASGVAAYEKDIWTHALGGGRLNFLAVPVKENKEMSVTHLLGGELMRGDARIRLLNFISKTPLDCPVAVIFGHACAMNWAGPAYDDVGIGVTDRLWAAGYPADLIPSSEIENGSLKNADDGTIQYGPQRYAAAVLYHPEFENPATAAFFQRAAAGKTALVRVGDWTKDFEGRPFDGAAALPDSTAALPDAESCATAVIRDLRTAGIAVQTLNTELLAGFHRQSMAPGAHGRSRLVDGTQIVISGVKRASGDPIQTVLDVKGHKVEVDAIGIAAVRLTDEGAFAALAAGGLKRFRTADVTIELPERADLALWRDEQGRLQGVLQDWNGPVPSVLAELTADWLRLAVPAPLPPEQQWLEKWWAGWLAPRGERRVAERRHPHSLGSRETYRP
jgi:hypothetical protein